MQIMQMPCQRLSSAYCVFRRGTLLNKALGPYMLSIRAFERLSSDSYLLDAGPYTTTAWWQQKLWPKLPTHTIKQATTQ